MIGRSIIFGWTAGCALLANSLPEQSITLLLDRSFPQAEVSYLLLDAPTGRLVCSRWSRPERSIPVGSLVKPFTALAYGETHAFVFPQLACRGVQDRCWLPRGHGRIGLPEAVADSCNAYFLSLAANVNSDMLEATERRFDLPPPQPGASAGALIGLGDPWLVSPISIARAYCELVRRSAEPGIGELLKGLSLSAGSGTGRAVGTGAYCKTGTALCSHSPKHAADGFAIAMFPADAPRFTLLVRVDGVTGAQSAVVCGRMRALLDARRR